jgi:hypothetical protein
VSDLFEQPDDATPLTPEEMRDLIPAHIAYRRELNEAEQENIARAQDWALGRNRDPLSEKFVKDLHRRMLERRMALGWEVQDERTQYRDPSLGNSGRPAPPAGRHQGADRIQDLPAGGDRGALPSPACADSLVPERQRPARPAHRGSSGDEARA